MRTTKTSLGEWHLIDQNNRFFWRNRQDGKLKPEAIGEIPELTRSVPEAVFPKGKPYMKLRKEFGVVYDEEDFAKLFLVLDNQRIPLAKWLLGQNPCPYAGVLPVIQLGYAVLLASTQCIGTSPTVSKGGALLDPNE